jgi:hypothetical protein
MSVHHTAVSRVSPAHFPEDATPQVLDDAQLAEVVRITEEVFGLTPEVETMKDPEDPDETPFLVFAVQARGTTRELLDLHYLWHDRIDSLNGDLSLRLSIIPVS